VFRGLRSGRFGFLPHGPPSEGLPGFTKTG
jgi:hypothetical protein